MLITKKLVEKYNKIVAKELGVKIKKGTSKTRNSIGIHLLNPDAFELSDALESCERDCIQTIYVYNKRSWI